MNNLGSLPSFYYTRIMASTFRLKRKCFGMPTFGIKNLINAARGVKTVAVKDAAGKLVKDANGVVQTAQKELGTGARIWEGAKGVGKVGAVGVTVGAGVATGKALTGNMGDDSVGY